MSLVISVVFDCEARVAERAHSAQPREADATEVSFQSASLGEESPKRDEETEFSAQVCPREPAMPALSAPVNPN